MIYRNIFYFLALIFVFNACGDVAPIEETTTPTQSNETTTETNDPLVDVNLTLSNPLYKTLGVGFGDSGSFSFMGNDDEVRWVNAIDLILDDTIETDGYYNEIKNFNPSQFDILQQHLKNTKYVVYWVTKGWWEGWFNIDKIQEAMDRGIVPVFNYWYYGDTLGGEFPTDESIVNYTIDNQKFTAFLKKLNGTKIVIMEPEFNKAIITDVDENQHKFAKIISDAITLIKSDTQDVLFSVSMTDKGRRDVDTISESCGYDNCALGDQNEWIKPSIVYNDLSSQLDFISFQEMLGQFSRDPDNPGNWDEINPVSYTDNGIGIDFLAERVTNLARFLRNTYHKPVFMPYVGIATATWHDTNSDNIIEQDELDLTGWEQQSDNFYRELMLRKSELLAHNLFGFATMSLFDHPKNDYDGYQYFLNNEYHLGIIKSSAVDEIDTYRFGDIEFKLNIIETIFSQQ